MTTVASEFSIPLIATARRVPESRLMRCKSARMSAALW
jgi:hypothetical protein